MARDNVVSVRASGHHKTPDLDLRFRGQKTFEILLYDTVRNACVFYMASIVIGLVVGKPHVCDRQERVNGDRWRVERGIEACVQTVGLERLE